MNKTYTLKVLYPFSDMQENLKRKKDDVFECSEKRALELIEFEKYKLVEILSIIRK
jgi:hypothetical protein